MSKLLVWVSGVLSCQRPLGNYIELPQSCASLGLADWSRSLSITICHCLRPAFGSINTLAPPRFWQTLLPVREYPKLSPRCFSGKSPQCQRALGWEEIWVGLIERQHLLQCDFSIQHFPNKLDLLSWNILEASFSHSIIWVSYLS